jgi:sugar lactone lactonase YvrE
VIALPAQAATFTFGDVFASKSGSVREYSPTGVFVQALTSGISGFTTGSAFSSSGTLFVTDFSSGQIITFANNAANTQGQFAAGFAFSQPEDIRFDAAGNVFISDLGGHGLRKFNAAGTAVVQSWAVGTRIDWFDIDAGQTTMWYTDESGTIHRWNLITNTALPNLCSNCGEFALRLLGDGTLLVADGLGGVNRVNATTGAIIQSYLTGVNKEFFALNLDPDGTTFWTGEFSTDNIYRLNIATGATVTGPFTSGSGGGSLYGLSVFGERTQVGGTPEPITLLMLGTGLVGLVVTKRRYGK